MDVMFCHEKSETQNASMDESQQLVNQCQTEKLMLYFKNSIKIVVILQQ